MCKGTSVHVGVCEGHVEWPGVRGACVYVGAQGHKCVCVGGTGHKCVCKAYLDVQGHNCVCALGTCACKGTWVGVQGARWGVSVQGHKCVCVRALWVCRGTSVGVRGTRVCKGHVGACVCERAQVWACKGHACARSMSACMRERARACAHGDVCAREGECTELCACKGTWGCARDTCTGMHEGTRTCVCVCARE